MTYNELLNCKTIHFIGISSPVSTFCAKYLINQGIKVTASELNQANENGKMWLAQEVLYPGGHNKDYITNKLDLVVYPTGPIPGNPECTEAERLKLKTITVAQLLGLISQKYKTIAVAGAHGKSTTTALIVWMLKNLLPEGLPNFILGGAEDKILTLNTNWNFNPKSECFVIEACEYKRQFLDRVPHPYISVITHIDLDHTDYYKNQDDYNNAFSEFLANTTNAIIINANDNNEQNVLNILNRSTDHRVNASAKHNVTHKPKIFNVGDYVATPKAKSASTNSATFKNTTVPITFGNSINTVLPMTNSQLQGRHNQENWIRAYISGIVLGLPPKSVENALNSFPGLALRFEFSGKTINGSPLYKDYAHNPTKIKACLEGVQQQFPDKRKVLIFQPHSFERSYTFKEAFATSIIAADVVIIPNIYSPTRETPEQKKLITEEEFTQALQSKNPDKPIFYTNGFANCLDKIAELDDGNCVFIFASAGDLHTLVPRIKEKKIVCAGAGGGAVFYAARYLHLLGNTVIGYDVTENERTKKLNSVGITVHKTNPANEFEKDTDLVLYSAALPNELIKSMCEKNPTILFCEVGVFVNNLIIDFDTNRLSNAERNAFLESEIAPLYSLDYSKMIYIGVTGTDGKTTTASMLYHMLNNCNRGFKVGLVSTVSAYIGKEEMDTGLHTTTPSSQDLYKLIKKAELAGCTHLILEITSHGLAMGRVAGLKLDTAIFTNITNEHLDYHKTWENYATAKSKLAINCLKDNGFTVLNYDDTASYNFLRPLLKSKVILYSVNSNPHIPNKEIDTLLIATNIKEQDDTIDFDVTTIEKKELANKYQHVTLNMLGNYNISNALASIACLRGLNIDTSCAQTLNSFQTINGRMEIIQTTPYYIIVDFAHTPNALENALKTANKLKKNVDSKVITVFGCAGKRDDSKRGPMGAIAYQWADITILTAEDPRTEKLNVINDTIAQGWQKAYKSACDGESNIRTHTDTTAKKLIRFDDATQNVKVRLDAIKYALNIAKPGDIIIACGKAHEKSLCFGLTEYPWNDIEQIKALIQSV